MQIASYRLKQSAFFMALIFLSLFCGYYFAKFYPEGLNITYGSNDFIEYWSSFFLFLHNQDPFNPILMSEIQKSLGWQEGEPLMMHNPPWIFPILGIFLFQDFKAASISWLIFNISLIFLSTKILIGTFTNIKIATFIKSSLYILPFIFYPTLLTLELGQLSILLFFGMSLLLYSINKNDPLLSAVAIIILSLKPHLYFLIILFVILNRFKCKDLSFFAYLSTIFILINITIILINPNIYNYYFTPINNRGLKIDGINDFYTSTLTGILKFLTEVKFSYPLKKWSLLVIPMIGCGLALLKTYQARAKREEIFKIEQSKLISLMIFNYIISPYGWTFDFTILLIPIYYLILKSKDKKEQYISILFLIFSSILMLTPSLHVYNFWAPLCYYFFYNKLLSKIR